MLATLAVTVDTALEPFNGFTTPWLSDLARSTWQSGLFVVAVLAFCRLFPKLPAAVRCWLWWLACLKMLVGLLWIWPIDLPVLAPALAPAIESKAPFPINVPGVTPFAVQPSALSPAPITAAAPISESNPSKPTPWAAMIACLWTAGLCWRGLILIRQYADSRRLAGSARHIEGTWIRETGERLARCIGLSYIPHVCTSREVQSPVVVGVIEPVILIPEGDMYGADNDSLRLALAHELAHIRRSDLWLGALPTLAQTLFFFNPLAWLAAREYALAREEACDAEAIRLTGITPHDYGKLLMKFGVSERPNTTVVGVGPINNAKLLKRRLEMLQHANEMSPRATAVCLALVLMVATIGMVPVRLVAQRPHDAAAPAASQLASNAPSLSGSPTANSAQNSIAAAQPGAPAICRQGPGFDDAMIAAGHITSAVAVSASTAAVSLTADQAAAPTPAASPAPAVVPFPSGPATDADIDAWSRQFADQISKSVMQALQSDPNMSEIMKGKGKDWSAYKLTPDQKAAIKRQADAARQQVEAARAAIPAGRQYALMGMNAAIGPLQQQIKDLDQQMADLRSQKSGASIDTDSLDSEMKILQRERDALDQASKGIQQSIDEMRKDMNSRGSGSSDNSMMKPSGLRLIAPDGRSEMRISSLIPGAQAEILTPAAFRAIEQGFGDPSDMGMSGSLTVVIRVVRSDEAGHSETTVMTQHTRHDHSAWRSSSSSSDSSSCDDDGDDNSNSSSDDCSGDDDDSSGSGDDDSSSIKA